MYFPIRAIFVYFSIFIHRAIVLDVLSVSSGLLHNENEYLDTDA